MNENLRCPHFSPNPDIGKPTEPNLALRNRNNLDYWALEHWYSRTQEQPNILRIGARNASFEVAGNAFIIPFSRVNTTQDALKYLLPEAERRKDTITELPSFDRKIYQTSGIVKGTHRINTVVDITDILAGSPEFMFDGRPTQIWALTNAPGGYKAPESGKIRSVLPLQDLGLQGI